MAIDCDLRVPASFQNDTFFLFTQTRAFSNLYTLESIFCVYQENIVGQTGPKFHRLKLVKWDGCSHPYYNVTYFEFRKLNCHILTSVGHICVAMLIYLKWNVAYISEKLLSHITQSR